ncbi:MAG: branched-chain amino acid ABC transporter substrate-binding protein [Thermoleophilia bacterium]|nr:branched-chain amino acid ABC transporter substrate-binding protein [Thermoleophilia bacterium]MDH4339722.1 branched-chain amino acid ABC transporter substrate-binding protein [Thermoleophilia bacterium]
MRKVIVLMFAAVAAFSAIAASVAGADSTRAAGTAAPSCKQALIALTGPYTGPAGTAGLDQRNWGRIFISSWNAGKPIPGVPKGFKRTKLKAIEADTALNPQLAATVAVQLRSNKNLLAVNGFSGSQENVAGGPILRRGGVPFVSGSATRASLTDPTEPDGSVLKSGFFRRVVPTDKRQGATDAAFALNKLGVKSGDAVMTVDQAEAYSVPLITLITQLLNRAGVNVSRESQSAAQTDFTSLANKAVAQKAKVVVLATQVASNAQLFYNQLKSKGFTGAFLATDGAFDSSQFKVAGAYISSFSLDIHDVPVAKPFVADFEKKYGETISFGAPSFVAVQAIAMGISTSCANGKTSRAEVRRDIGKVKMKTSLLGKPIAFDKFGDVVGGVGFTMFQIGNDGTYNVVQKG